jgi:hypothetical protein
MPRPDRAEILRRAKDTFREHGRGFVVVVEGRDEPHYGFPDELQHALADEEEAVGIVKAAAGAVAAYDPQREAVVIDERAEGIFVVIVGPVQTRVIGELFWESKH